MNTEFTFGLRREAKRHAALEEHSHLRKAVSPLRSATALQNMASLLLCAFALLPLGLRAATNNLTAALQQGLFEEEANRNLGAAVSNYQSLAEQFDKDRQVAATAIFRLGECYRKLGQTNEAVVQYQRILREFSDQKTLATLSRQNLTGLGTVSQPQLQQRLQAIITKNPQDSERTRELELVKKLQAMPLDEVRQAAPTLLTDATLINLIYQYNQCELDLLRLRVDHAEDHPDVKKILAIRDGLGGKIRERLEGLSHALSLDLASSGNIANTSTEAVSQPAIGEEDREIQRIQTMIQNSPDLINAPGEGGNTPLTQAAYKGWLKVAAYLMDHGADVNTGGIPPLNAAATVGNRAMTELLLSRGANVNAKGSQGKTPLNTAVEKKFPSVAEVLLANKADVNAQDDRGNTPLGLAAEKGQVKIILMLLAAGANPNLENKNGQIPFSLAAGSGSPEIVKMFLTAKANPNGGRMDAPLLAAIYARDHMAAELLLEAGANPNVEGLVHWQDYSSGYHYEGAYGCGWAKPLWLAVRMGQLPMVNLLLKYKADPNDSQTDSLPLLFSALSDTNVLETLLDGGGKADSHTLSGWPLLNDAVGKTNLAAVQILLRHGADVNVRYNGHGSDTDGSTPLHVAARSGADRKMFELLLDWKADPNTRDDSERTPLDLVKERRARYLDPQTKAEADQVIALLHARGALDDLPKLDRIEVCRSSAKISYTVFRKGTNDWNQFTLIELIGEQYGFVSTDPAPTYQTTQFGDDQWDRNDFRFPDFSKVTIQRAVVGGTQRKTIEVDLESLLASGDRSRNVVLQWGDRVEIPEADHPVDQQWSGLGTNQIIALAKCVTRNVILIVKDATNSVAIGPYYQPSSGPMLSPVKTPLVPGIKFRETPADDRFRYPIWSMQKAAGRFMLTAVLRDSGMLRASSDLTRVKVTRHDPKTGKKLEWVLNCASLPKPGPTDANSTFQQRLRAITEAASRNDGQFGAAPELWLRDGDVIEVPEKP